MNHCSSETRGHSLNASPSKRVFSMPPPKKAPLNTPGTPVLEDFPQNDDEKERLQRRRSRAFELQFSIDSPRLLASPSSRWVCSGLPHRVAPDMGAWAWRLHTTSSILGLDFEKLQHHGSTPEFFIFCFSFRNIDISATIPKFTNTQITEHYSTCIKLSTENVSICWGLSEKLLQLEHRGNLALIL